MSFNMTPRALTKAELIRFLDECDSGAQMVAVLDIFKEYGYIK